MGDWRRADYRECEVSRSSEKIHSVLIQTTERTVGGSGSSRWQRSRSHFVQTNNTAVCCCLSSSQWADSPRKSFRYVTLSQSESGAQAPPRRPSLLRWAPPTQSLNTFMAGEHEAAQISTVRMEHAANTMYSMDKPEHYITAETICFRYKTGKTRPQCCTVSC